MTDNIGSSWPLEHYGVVARHLGQFNGAYLKGRPVPSHRWLSRGRVHPRMDQVDVYMAQLRLASLLLRTFFISVLTHESQHARWEQAFGLPVEQVVDHWAELPAFVLGLEEEARRLMDELSGELSAFSP